MAVQLVGEVLSNCESVYVVEQRRGWKYLSSHDGVELYGSRIHNALPGHAPFDENWRIVWEEFANDLHIVLSPLSSCWGVIR